MRRAEAIETESQSRGTVCTPIREKSEPQANFGPGSSASTRRRLLPEALAPTGASVSGAATLLGQLLSWSDGFHVIYGTKDNSHSHALGENDDFANSRTLRGNTRNI